MIKFKIWWFKWSARLRGGEAIWVKDNNTGKVFKCVAHKVFDPFNDERQDLIAKVGDIRKDTYTLDQTNGRLKEYSSAIWRYVDESKHVEQILKQK